MTTPCDMLAKVTAVEWTFLGTVLSLWAWWDLEREATDGPLNVPASVFSNRTDFSF